MEQRVSLITLGVADPAASKAFYERLGWHCALDVHETVFFQLGGVIFTLWSRDKLAQDVNVTDDGGWGGVALAHNVRSESEVDAVIEQARSAGATISVEPRTTFYGGYAGTFVDPDGHPWEIAFNPGFPVAGDGTISIPEPLRS
ncbi:MAG TPA: VOC family protein [Solirubrobacterales bacterium]|jgi:predicted lactoylglutathione lyase|nr:VOC family protein [Solirubrobacterales bacterium]